MRAFRSFIVLPALLFSFLTVAGSGSIADDDLFVDFEQVDSAIRIQVTNKSQNTIYLHDKLLPITFFYRDENTGGGLGSALSYALPTHRSEKNIVSVSPGKSYTTVVPLPVDLATRPLSSLDSFTIRYSQKKSGYLKGDREHISVPSRKRTSRKKKAKETGSKTNSITATPSKFRGSEIERRQDRIWEQKKGHLIFMPPTSRGRRARLRRVTFDVFAQFLRQHTMNVLLNF